MSYEYSQEDRLCFVCKKPLPARKAVDFSLGNGLALKAHTRCLDALQEVIDPQSTPKPIHKAGGLKSPVGGWVPETPPQVRPLSKARPSPKGPQTTRHAFQGGTLPASPLMSRALLDAGYTPEVVAELIEEVKREADPAVIARIIQERYPD
jgi:hypothetical protein